MAFLRIGKGQILAAQKSSYATVAKVIFSGTLFYLILRNASLGEVFSSVRSANMNLLLLVLALNMGLATYLRSYRWKKLLKVQGVDLPMGFLLRSTMVSYFFNNFLPSTIGGDVIRMYDIWRVVRAKGNAFAVVFLDRVLGILALVLLAVIALPFSSKLSDSISFLLILVPLGAIPVVVFIFMIFTQSKLKAAFERKLVAFSPARVKTSVEDLLQAFRAFHGRNDVLLWSLILSFVIQASIIIQHFLIARALGLPVPIYDFFVIVPLATIIMMAPISINAIGVREVIFVVLFATYGVTTSDAIAFSWLLYGKTILTGLMGGVVFLIRSKRPPLDYLAVDTLQSTQTPRVASSE